MPAEDDKPRRGALDGTAAGRFLAGAQRHWLVKAALAVLCVLFSMAVFRVIMLHTQQQCLRAIVREMTVVMEKYGAEYWWDFGTLLGLVREGDIIYTEVDADISITIETRKAQFHDPAFLADLSALGYTIQERDEIKLRIFSPYGWFADMDVWVRSNSTHMFMTTGKNVDKSRYVLPTAWLLPPLPIKDTRCEIMRRLKYLESSVRVPAKPSVVLEYWYSPTWRVPRHYDKGNDPSGDKMELFFWSHLLWAWETFIAIKHAARMYITCMPALLRGIFLLPNLLAMLPYGALAYYLYRTPSARAPLVAGLGVLAAIGASALTLVLAVFVLV